MSEPDLDFEMREGCRLRAKWWEEHMTASAQTLYVCDRCNVRVYAPTQNAVTVVPEGWMAMVTGDDKQALSTTASVGHLCPDCADAFAKFMSKPR